MHSTGTKGLPISHHPEAQKATQSVSEARRKSQRSSAARLVNVQVNWRGNSFTLQTGKIESIIQREIIIKKGDKLKFLIITLLDFAHNKSV